MSNNEWSQPEAPPPPLFLGQQERDLTKQISEEIDEHFIGQTIMYYGIAQAETKYNTYGEAIQKTFYPPVRVYVSIQWNKMEEKNEFGQIDKKSQITVFFHKRRLEEDQKLDVSPGDYIRYGDRFYHIDGLEEPRNLFGQVEHKFVIAAVCKSVRKGKFKGELA